MTATNCQVGTERSLLLLFCLLQILENQRLDWDKQIKFPLFGQMNWYLGFLSVCLDNTCLKIRSLDWNQLSHLVTFTIAVFVAPLEMEVVMMVWSDFWLKFESQNRSLFPQIMGSSHLLALLLLQNLTGICACRPSHGHEQMVLQNHFWAKSSDDLLFWSKMAFRKHVTTSLFTLWMHVYHVYPIYRIFQLRFQSFLLNSHYCAQFCLLFTFQSYFHNFFWLGISKSLAFLWILWLL